jgi:chorismate mutase/SAM-dependent methyltransferase
MNLHPEKTNDALKAARARVTYLTDQLWDRYVERLEAMRLIAEAKKGAGDTAFPIFLPQREQDQRAKYRALALKVGVDPNMADVFVYMLMSAGKAAQLDYLHRETIFDTVRPRDVELRKNLLALTAHVAASYGQHYGEGKTGWGIESARETMLIERITGLFRGGTAVNLGCADGTLVTPILGGIFDRVIGYDISPHMIREASRKFPGYEFIVHDLDTWVPLPDGSVNLVVANSGAASEVCNGNPFSEVGRLLTRGGFAFLSFYNQDALINKWRAPWPNTFTVTMNPYNDTIMVPVEGEHDSVSIYWINASIVTAEDLTGWASDAGLRIELIESSSPLWDDKPPEFFNHPDAVRSALAYEDMHADVPPYIGQYLRVIVRKG